MQAASTLWPTKNHRKYQSTESGSIRPSVAQEPKQIQLRQAVPQLLDKRRPRQAQPLAAGSGWHPGWTGRPPWSADQPMGPTAFSQLCGSVSLASNGGSSRKSFIPALAPSYKYKGGGREWDTHTHTQVTSHSPQGILA